MHADLKALLYEAEHHYLSSEEMNLFKSNISSLQERLEIYEELRDNEIAIFQPIADQLSILFAQENTEMIERSIKHWILVLRYAGMAMLFNHPQFLQYRLLEWLTDIVQAHPLPAINHHLYSLLQEQLKTLLGDRLTLMQPFLEQIETSLLKTKSAV